MEETIVTAISTVGFPIVAFLLMFIKLDKTIQLLSQNVSNNTTLLKVFMEREHKNG